MSPEHGLRAAIDLESLKGFCAGQSCLLRVKVMSDLQAVTSLSILPKLSSAEIQPASVERLMPGTAATAVSHFIPPIAGQHILELEFVANLASGEVLNLFAAPLHVKVGSAGPAVQIVNIDQSQARVVDNSRSNFGNAPTGGILGDDWQGLELSVREVRPVAPPKRTSAVSFSVATPRARYEATKTVARGDLSTVFGASSSLGEHLVLKIVDDRVDNDLMLNEARALDLLAASESSAKIHLPKLLDRFRTEDGRVGHAFERLDGLDLLEVRRRLPEGLPPRHLVWVMRRSFAALAHAHSCGILHGNLDPSHILIRPHDHMLWLVDWCYAIINPAQTGDRFKALNEEMSPPEVAERKAPLPASDLYSLGKAMFFLAGGDPKEKTLPPMDPRLERFLRFMVVESQRGRAQDALELYHEVDRIRGQIWGPHTFVPLDI
jgi:hypothetical protein